MDTKTWTFIFVGVTFTLYLAIAWMTRVRDTRGFYVAGQGVPAMANGMATAADWMSASSFISMAGLISFMGYAGGVYLMGWTGGYVLLALLLAPYLRKFGHFTMPDFVGQRFESDVARVVAVICALFICFIYVAGQMRGVGIVFSRFLEVDINTGIALPIGNLLEDGQVVTDDVVGLAARVREIEPLVVEGGSILSDSIPAIRDALGFTDNVLPANDDGSTSLVDIGFTTNFFGTPYDQLFVNNNGNVTFDRSLFSFTPFNLLTTDSVIIAPFFADVDTRVGNVVTYGTDVVDGVNVFGVNWIDVGYFSQNVDKINRFQLVMIDRSDIEPGAFDFEFNYEQIQWETGEASGGVDGLGGSSARAGFSNGEDQFFELEGSAVNGALLDSNTETGLINNSQDSIINGRYYFQVRGGEVGGSVPVQQVVDLLGVLRSGGTDQLLTIDTSTGIVTENLGNIVFDTNDDGVANAPASIIDIETGSNGELFAFQFRRQRPAFHGIDRHHCTGAFGADQRSGRRRLGPDRSVGPRTVHVRP